MTFLFSANHDISILLQQSDGFCRPAKAPACYNIRLSHPIMPPLRLALAQLNVTVGDLDGNRQLVAEAVRRAQAWMADLVVVPELAVTGYPPEDLLLKPQFVEA